MAKKLIRKIPDFLWSLLCTAVILVGPGRKVQRRYWETVGYRGLRKPHISSGLGHKMRRKILSVN